MVAWVQPIIDRTQSDVVSKTTKGFINNSDLNRINEDISYLKSVLWDQGYYSTVDAKTNWIMSDFPTKLLMDKCIQNINNLINCFTVISTTPTLPLDFENMTYDKLNALEQNLLDIYTLQNNMQQTYNYCGDCIMGG